MILNKSFTSGIILWIFKKNNNNNYYYYYSGPKQKKRYFHERKTGVKPKPPNEVYSHDETRVVKHMWHLPNVWLPGMCRTSNATTVCQYKYCTLP